MRVILKPMGVVIVLSAIAGLTALAFIPRWTAPKADDTKGGGFTWSSQSAASPTPVATGASASPMATPTSRAYPGPGTYPGAGSPAPSASAGTIFSDSAVNGWQTEGWSWAKDIDFKQTKIVHSGTSAIRVRYTNYDGVKFHHDALDTHPYNRLSFYVYGEEGGQTIQVVVEGSGGKSGPSAAQFTLPANKWVAVTIPLEVLGAKDRANLTDFFIQGMSDKTLPPVYIDDVRLLTPSDPTPGGDSLELRAVPTGQN